MESSSPVNFGTLEVEMKFAVPNHTDLEERLARLGVRLGERILEEDYYFRHPSRDFSATDEAFRIRRAGTALFLTYKGPKIDPATKTRREIEISLSGCEASWEEWQNLFSALGFGSAGVVRKQRRRGVIPYQGLEIQITLDSVDGLGDFAELEVCCTPENFGKTREAVISLAEELGLNAGERRSYLELLMEKAST